MFFRDPPILRILFNTLEKKRYGSDVKNQLGRCPQTSLRLFRRLQAVNWDQGLILAF